MNGNSPRDPRYSRQVILPGVGSQGQAKLGKAKVLVVGMGGLGSPASLYLAAAGVGVLGIADNDTVEKSNLHRQILHDDHATGREKILSAKDRLSALNPDIRIEPIDEGINAANAVEVFREYDLIVDGTDNFPTRYLINDAAFLSGRPVVYGSIFQFEGQVSLFHPHGGGPCYRCLFPELPEPGTVPNCAEAGVFGALCGIVGSWQASEAIKWIIGLGEPLIGKMKILDTLNGRDQIVSLKKDSSCPLCGDQAVISEIDPRQYDYSCLMDTQSEPDALPLEIDVQTAAELLKSDNPPELLDVREAYEHQTCHLRGARHIPTGEIQFKWDSLPRDKHLLVYCHHGMRSLFVTRFLHENGITQAQSIKGGIDAWSKHIDPAVPRY